jgi:glycosyltransferase involved in cell wall biosynthesis
MPTVSVIIPTYNRIAHLNRTIQSVLNQRFEDLELVVVDDASTENTESVVEAFDDERVRYLEHEVNRGGSAARNAGIEASTGKYVAFLDDDDAWLPHKLERQIGCLEECSEEWVATYCDIHVVRHGVTSRLRELLAEVLPVGHSKSRPEGGAELIPVVLAREFPLGGASTLVVRRTAVDQLGGFDVRFERLQDWEFLARLLRIGKIAHVDDTLVVKHETTFPSAETVSAAQEVFFEEFSSEIERAERNGYDVVAAHRFALARSLFVDGRFVEGFRHLNGATIDPLALAQSICTGVYLRATRSL